MGSLLPGQRSRRLPHVPDLIGVGVQMPTKRLIAAEIEYMKSLFGPIQSMFGGIEIAQFAEAVAFHMPANNDPLFNRVLGFDENSIQSLDAILDWHAQRNTPCRFEIISDASSQTVEEVLTHRGFSSRAVESFLCSAPFRSPLPVQDVQICKLALDDLDEFASAFLAVYPSEPSVEPLVRTCLKAQYSQPGWHCYLARLEGEVAAFGAMRVQSGVASLISSATLPHLRRRGCQTALLQRRMADAADLDCDLVFSHAACESTSQHNMQRLGMRLLAPKLVWGKLSEVSS